MDPTSRPRRGRATSLALALATIFMLVATLVTPAVAAAADPTADQSAPVTTPASSDTPASSPDASATPAPTARYIVSFASGTADDQAAIIAAAGATQVDTIPQLQMYVVDADATAVAVLSAATGVSSVTPDDVRDAGAVPSDPSYADQWSLPKIGWDQVYGNAQLSGNAVVALLDTGVDSHNPDIANQLVAGTSIIAGSNPTEDPNGHGTAMAGIIAAETNNGSDIAGIGYSNVKIMPITVLNASGLGQDDDIIAGVVYAVGHGADVINMSFSNPGYSPALQAAINYAWAHNVVVVAATGNDGSSGVTFPAGDKGVIGVSNTDQNDALNSTSNFGADTFLAAPGTDIVTLAAGGDTTSVTGTSASSAEVAAAAALLRAADPSAKNGVIVSRLARNADAVGTVDQTGNGRLNLARAIADTSTDSVEPAGAAPVGSGGPFVGPYVAAAATTVSSVNSTTANGTYGIGASISIQITFSGSETVVTTGGTPTLALNSGGTASYASGSGSATLTFNYTVAASQNNADLDYSATTSLALNGGTITNSTTAATLALPTPGAANSLGANKALVIDTNPHTCTWTGGTSTAWATATNWSGCANVAPQTGDAVVIGPIASPTNWPTLIASTTVTSISITGRTVTTNQRGGCLTIATGQTLTVSGNLTITGSIDGGTGTTCGTGTATGIIASGTANLSVGGNVLLTDSTGGPPENPIISMGSGTLTVAGNFTKGTNSTFTAGTSTALFNGSGAQSISGSTIAFNNLTIGDGTHSPTVTLGANVTVGSALNVTAGTYTAVTYTTTVTGMTTVTGAIYTGGSGTQTLTGGLTMTGGTVTSTGTISLGGNVTTNASASSATISGGTLSLGATRTFTIAGDLVVSSIISGTAFGLTKTGSGTLTLSGVNTYTGVTTINAGTLSVGTIGNGGARPATLARRPLQRPTSCSAAAPCSTPAPLPRPTATSP